MGLSVAGGTSADLPDLSKLGAVLATVKDASRRHAVACGHP
jgi:hypothetical protein